MEDKRARDLAGKSYDQMTHDEILREHSKRYPKGPTRWERIRDDILKFVFGMSALLLILYFLNVWLTPEKQRLAEKYQIPQEAVSIDPKPHGCDFGDAPLGNKHCHYERKEEPVRNEQQKVVAVYVTWDKVEE